MEGQNELSGSEAIFGFCGWLTTRKEKTVMSSSDDCAPIVELITEFINTQKLPEPSHHWEKKLVSMNPNLNKQVPA